jgi:hypothetical protein
MIAVCETTCLHERKNFRKRGTLISRLLRKTQFNISSSVAYDRLCGLVIRVLSYRSGGPGSIPGTTRKKKVMDLERGSLSLVSTTEELLDRKAAAPV